MNKLKLPKKERPIGLYLYCSKHKRSYANDSVIKCKCDNLIYKCKIHIPGTGDKCKTKNLKAKIFDDALIEYRTFKKELVNNSFQKIMIKEENQKPIVLIDCIAVYMDFLNNIGVPFHKQKVRAKKTIRDSERYLEYFLYSLKENDIDACLLKFTDINEKIVGFVCQYGLETKKMRNKTYNNYVSTLKSFTNYIIKKYDLNFKNPFESVKQRKVVPIKKSVSFQEFIRLLDIVKYENGYYTEKGGKRFNIYRPWLIDAFKLGLFTGGRREEVVELRWNGIKLNENGEISRIEVNHFKNNRAQSDIISEDEYEIKKIAMNQDLYSILMNLGYEKYKNTNGFILAPEEKASRKRMISIITIAFTHFYKKLNTGEVKNFKHLRKTYSTAKYIKHGEKTHEETGHTNMAVLHKHYIDDNVVLEAEQEEAKKYERLFKDV